MQNNLDTSLDLWNSVHLGNSQGTNISLLQRLQSKILKEILQTPRHIKLDSSSAYKQSMVEEISNFTQKFKFRLLDHTDICARISEEEAATGIMNILLCLTSELLVIGQITH